MKAWLEQPVTRAEVIGWVLAVPAVIYIGFLGSSVVPMLRTTDSMAAHSGFVPLFLATCLRLGEGGLAAVFAFCAVIALGAQLTRQRPLLRVVAPLVGVLLAHAMSVRYVTSMAELAMYRGATLGATADDATPFEDGPR